ncbi:hypothetical protein ACFLZN_01495 [Nanoarchaeota archaeon]
MKKFAFDYLTLEKKSLLRNILVTGFLLWIVALVHQWSHDNLVFSINLIYLLLLTLLVSTVIWLIAFGISLIYK